MNPTLSNQTTSTFSDDDEIISAFSLEQIIQHLLNSDNITRSQQKWCLTTLFSNHSLTSKQFNAIVKICNRLQAGSLRIID